MKLVLGAAAAAVLFLGGAAMAQTTTPLPPSNCPTVGAEPSLPEGTTANQDAITSADQAYQTWASATSARLQCLRAEKEHHEAITHARVEEFNTLNTQLRTVTERWAAEREAYCSRPRIRCRVSE
jgi:hypothetical protein